MHARIDDQGRSRIEAACLFDTAFELWSLRLRCSDRLQQTLPAFAVDLDCVFGGIEQVLCSRLRSLIRKDRFFDGAGATLQEHGPGSIQAGLGSRQFVIRVAIQFLQDLFWLELQFGGYIVTCIRDSAFK